jgi:hypothetical protein
LHVRRGEQADGAAHMRPKNIFGPSTRFIPGWAQSTTRPPLAAGNLQSNRALQGASSRISSPGKMPCSRPPSLHRAGPSGAETQAAARPRLALPCGLPGSRCSCAWLCWPSARCDRKRSVDTGGDLGCCFQTLLAGALQLASVVPTVTSCGRRWRAAWEVTGTPS